MKRYKGCTEYYFGVYVKNEYPGGGRVLQVVNNKDSFSCELLADQFGENCFMKVDFTKVKYMINHAIVLAKELKCSHIEINCKQGAGSYRWMKSPDAVMEDKTRLQFRCLTWDNEQGKYVLMHSKCITVYTGNFPDLFDGILDFLKDKFKTSK